jgi:hypothetical protein
VLIHWQENFPVARTSVAAFGRRLADFGWVEGKNIRIDYRFAAGNPALFKSEVLAGGMSDVTYSTKSASLTSSVYRSHA